MRNLEQPNNEATARRLADIKNKAAERYGADALFVYPDPKTRQPVVMTLDQAMSFCGPAIAHEDDTALWAGLDKWRAIATKMEQTQADEFRRGIGRAAAKLEARVEHGDRAE